MAVPIKRLKTAVANCSDSNSLDYMTKSNNNLLLQWANR